jgi:hypothetical protein
MFLPPMEVYSKIGHTITDEREVVVEVPKDLVLRELESINESLRELVAPDLARRAAFGTFSTDAEPVVVLYNEVSPTWHNDKPHVMKE